MKFHMIWKEIWELRIPGEIIMVKKMGKMVKVMILEKR